MYFPLPPSILVVLARLHTVPAAAPGKEAAYAESGLSGRPAHLRAGAGRPAPADGVRRHSGGGTAPLCAGDGHSLAIQPNTHPSRAYELLEAEGYVSSVPGKGSFAAPHSQVDSARRDGLLRTFDETATELFFLGLSADALSQRLSKLDGGVRQ